MKSHSFTAIIEMIGINPYVQIPETILKEIFVQAGKTKGHIPIKGTVNKQLYTQTLLKYSGLWRLYINTTMLKNSPKRIGEEINITIEFDPSDRTIAPHPKFLEALKNNLEAKSKFDNLSPSAKKEMVRYITSLKTEESRDRIIERAITYLLGKSTFIGKKSWSNDQYTTLYTSRTSK
ncbi:YdeI/OmpD-associated family protein [Tamlana sp. 2_MG-2023]|uniref:YdeI/OmpD-associated family protein n=1 Tax=unclassified Tamlana TaxID=2614803 RepID=UPI0026E3A523|nr:MULTISPECIES: YdeI/OmpD-associated family protein [unclassified Tamlana]MDO6761696.1 YdeI/OmpD-associated family protein [Tamlana sp. 2_MG-2023]MDO6792250.1 YdeI/OmpD-associated family protein [Tamlana sp. 1_MG-2023]